MKVLIPAILVAACAEPLVACDLCAIYSASQARGEVGAGAFVGVAEQFTHFGTVQVEGQKVPDPSGQYLNSSISQAFVGYNFSDRLGMQLNIPVIYRSFKRPDGSGGIDRGIESGIGDLSILGAWVPYRQLDENFTLAWTLLGGVQFPTGSSDRLKEEFNEVENPVGPPSGIHGHDLTLGTGSYDGVVGSSIYSRWQRWFLTANAQYTIRSRGDFEYRFANDLTWSGGPGYLVVLAHEYTFAVQAVVSGEYKAKDRFGSEVAQDTGVSAVYLGPLLSFTWHENLAAYAGADLPILINNTSLQTVSDYRIRAGLTWHF